MIFGICGLRWAVTLGRVEIGSKLMRCAILDMLSPPYLVAADARFARLRDLRKTVSGEISPPCGLLAHKFSRPTVSSSSFRSPIRIAQRRADAHSSQPPEKEKVK
ncbi:MAG: hypothetical protein M9939_25995 [Mesorhizobium sp.]|nr:hypothetical protein [Mesorhizobium sp.]MCO5164548.1 hypothetical protein [Mesorhizobium sp.]